MTKADRWEPDPQLVAVYLAGPRPELKLSAPDRAWVVAALTESGMTAEDISERLGISIRLVRTVRSDPMTQVCMVYQREVETFASELRMANADYRQLAVQLTATEAELTRTRNQLSALIGRTTFPKCGHPMDRYNTYEWTVNGKTKRRCRTCQRKQQSDRRAVTTGVTTCGITSTGSGTTSTDTRCRATPTGSAAAAASGGS